MLMLSGSPDAVCSMKEQFRLQKPHEITHVCERSNLFLEVKKYGSMKNVLDGELKNMNNRCDKMLVFTNSAAKAKKIKTYIENKGG